MLYINIEQRVSSESISSPSVQSNIWNVIPDLHHMKAKWNGIVWAEILTELQFPLTTFKYWSKIKLLFFFLALCGILKRCFLFCYFGGVLRLNSVHITLTMLLLHIVRSFVLVHFSFFFLTTLYLHSASGLKVISFRQSLFLEFAFLFNGL